MSRTGLIGLPLLILFALAMGPLGAAHPGHAIEIVIGNDGQARIAGHADEITRRHQVAGENYTFDLTLWRDLTDIDVRVDGGLDIQRAKQLVPEIDDRAQHPEVEHMQPHFFAEIQRNVTDIDSPANVVKIEQRQGGFTTHLGVRGPGSAVLTLRRDVTPPTFTVEAAKSITHFSFMLQATTNEFSLAELRIHPTAGGNDVIHRTPVPSLMQSFPVQGLAANTSYTYMVTFTDWAGNNVTSPVLSMRTAVKPVLTPPVFSNQTPTVDARMERVHIVSAQVVSQSPIRPEDVLFFIDKRPILEGFSWAPTELGATSYLFEYKQATPFSDGRHAVTIEVVNIDGAESGASWAFHVGTPRQSAPGPAVGALLIAAAGVVFALRQNRLRF